jgi:hypothetical protein
MFEPVGDGVEFGVVVGDEHVRETISAWSVHGTTMIVEIQTSRAMVATRRHKSEPLAKPDSEWHEVRPGG